MQVSNTYDGWLQVNKHSSRDMLSCSSFREKGVERIISPADGFITWHLTVRLNSMFQAIELPTSITDLGTSLANVYGDTFTLKERGKIVYINFSILRFSSNAIK